MKKTELSRLVAYVIRCSGAATLSYLLAGLLKLPHPVWACMSSLIVSQESLVEPAPRLEDELWGRYAEFASR